MAKRNNKVVKQEEGGVTEAPYEKLDIVKAVAEREFERDQQLKAQEAEKNARRISEEVASYKCGDSIPGLLKAILTELVRARLERG